MAHTVYLGLGTNLGDRLENLNKAVAILSETLQIRRVSPVYETEPWGYIQQPAFLNIVLSAETGLEPRALLEFLKNLEEAIGREETFRWGPRLIDIDILFYDDLVLTEQELQIPHLRIAERAFVLIPLADLAPGLRHPVSGKTAREMLAEVDPGGVKKFSGRIRRAYPLPWGERTYLMGILNLTPDSFSGDGILAREDATGAALEQARQFVAAGADILDLGGESTRPGAPPVSEEEEMRRVLPVIEALAAEGIDAILSLDTYKAAVAGAGLRAGADWINDVWALRADPAMAGVAAQWNCPLILMHNRLKPQSAELQERLGGRYVGVHYDNLLEDVQRELLESVAVARQAGVRDDRIILDPGIGFGKTVEQSLELLDRLGEIRALGFPVLLGPSRKSFIGYTLNLPPDQRMEGTAAAVAIGIDRGADIVRVHDVQPIARVVKMTDAIVRRSNEL